MKNVSLLRNTLIKSALHKHLLYSFNGKKFLYIIFLLTIVVVTIVSVYSINIIYDKIAVPVSHNLVFQNNNDYDLVALNNLVKSGDIQYVSENITVKAKSGNREVKLTALRENTNKWFGNNLDVEKIIVSSHIKNDFPNQDLVELIIGNKSFKILSISEVLLSVDIIFPYNTSNNDLNVKFSEFKDCNSSITLGNSKPITEELEKKLVATGLRMENLDTTKYYLPDIYDCYTYIIPSILVILAGLLCIVTAYGYILKKDSNLNELYKTVGANQKTFLATIILEMLTIFSIGYAIGCAAIIPMLKAMRMETIFVKGIDLFVIWAIFATLLTTLIIIIKRNVFLSNFNLAKKKFRKGEL